MRQEQQWEDELKTAGWKPTAAHPNSPTWRAPSGMVYAGPGYAHAIMQKFPKGEPLTPSLDDEAEAAIAAEQQHLADEQQAADKAKAEFEAAHLKQFQAAEREAVKASTPRPTACDAIVAALIVANPNAGEA